MQFLPLDRLTDAMPHGVTAEQILAMCRRAFGSTVRVQSARELGGGTSNATFSVTLADQQVILRIAPPPTAGLLWDEHWLMRREQQIRPFFAALGPLMPRTLMADFTHQLIDRDYVFQTHLPGDRWDEVADQFTPGESLRLWEQFGNIAKTIHSTIGTIYGGPHPAPAFRTWSGAVLHRMERAADAMAQERLDLADIQSVLATVRNQAARLDIIQQPHLLHGDLWLFNLLVARGDEGPNITGILDADRAWWGDPLADWTMFVLAHTEREGGHARFWWAYGLPDEPEAAFRRAVYDAMHIGTALAWATRHNDAETVQRGRCDLRTVAKTLATLT